LAGWRGIADFLLNRAVAARPVSNSLTIDGRALRNEPITLPCGPISFRIQPISRPAYVIAQQIGANLLEVELFSLRIAETSAGLDVFSRAIAVMSHQLGVTLNKKPEISQQIDVISLPSQAMSHRFYSNLQRFVPNSHDRRSLPAGVCACGPLRVG
jgi:hypothetical protein